MKRATRQKLAAEKAKIERRLEAATHSGGDAPMLGASNIHYELGDKTSASATGASGR